MKGHRFDELKVRAGVHPDAIQSDSEEVTEFNSYAEALMEIHAAKAVHYGDYIKTHGDETPQLFAVQHFCDIKRKYVRAKTFIERMTRGETVDFTDLLDTYSDLAVYAIMGLQMAFHCREKMQNNFDKIINCKHKWQYGIDAHPVCKDCGVEMAVAQQTPPNQDDDIPF